MIQSFGNMESVEWSSGRWGRLGRVPSERNGAGGIPCQPRDCRECSLPEDGTVEWTRSRGVHSAAVGSFRHDVISCAKKTPGRIPLPREISWPLVKYARPRARDRADIARFTDGRGVYFRFAIGTLGIAEYNEISRHAGDFD